MTRPLALDRYRDRRWLNPDAETARLLVEYLESEGRLPDEYLDVIREEQEARDGQLSEHGN